MSALLVASEIASTPTESTNTVTVTKPAGTAAGHILVGFFNIRNPVATPIVTAPDGWEEVPEVGLSQIGANLHKVYKKIAGASEPANYVWSWDQNAHGVVSIATINTHLGIDNIAARTTPGSTSHQTPELKTSEVSQLVLAWYSLNTDSSFAAPSDFAEEEDLASGINNAITGALYSKTEATAGTTLEPIATSAATESGTGTIVSFRDSGVTESNVNNTKSDIFDAQNIQAGITVITPDPDDKRLSLISVFLSVQAATNVKIEDGAGRLLMPTVSFAEKGTFTREFVAGARTTAPGQSIKVEADSTVLVSGEITAAILPT